METSFSEQDVVAANKRFQEQISQVVKVGSLLFVLYLASR